ncbi:MAG: aminoacyl-tRNA hydrolase [Chthoniobacteraceae bacterium]|nr:aminoacyl-tRNA hydrolase [Chthoniobacteraceae bacterium]
MDAARHSFRLLIGLGNPGKEYERTRHNVGFMVLDKLAARSGATWRTEKPWKAQIADCDGVVCCKPLSYMNLSGGPAQSVASFYKVPPAETLVVYDDLALPLGKLRLRPNGSAGGHNGMQSILTQFGTQEVPRLRLGIGAADSGMIGHVLGRFGADELPELEAALDRAVEAIEFAQNRGLQAAMNQFN